jgi:hypothetical protein
VPSPERGVLDPVDERNTRNQVVFREVNEHIAELSGGWALADVSLFICECSDQECAVALEITAEEYERVRADGARFVVRAGHELPELERVVDGNSRFLIVEKVGAPGTIARAADPRRHA